MRDTIEIAKEARVYVGCTEWTIEKSNTFVTTHKAIKAFEALVRADQREIDAKICEAHAGPELDFPDEYSNARDAMAFECAAAIREMNNT